MRKLLSTVMASALAASMAVAGVMPTSAAPVAQPSVPAAGQDVQTVQFLDGQGGADIYRFRNGGFRGRDFGNRGFRGDRGSWIRDRGWRGQRFSDRGDYRYWNGHRGYRSWRRGYREYDGYWFPLAAFAAGAVISGALNDSAPAYRGGNRHTRWCYNRYRSYRASDNTYQPNYGPRKQCRSPY